MKPTTDTMSMRNIEERHINGHEEVIASFGALQLVILVLLNSILRAHVRRVVVSSKAALLPVLGTLGALAFGSHIDLTAKGDAKRAYNRDNTRRAGIASSDVQIKIISVPRNEV